MWEIHKSRFVFCPRRSVAALLLAPRRRGLAPRPPVGCRCQRPAAQDLLGSKLSNFVIPASAARCPSCISSSLRSCLACKVEQLDQELLDKSVDRVRARISQHAPQSELRHMDRLRNIVHRDSQSYVTEPDCSHLNFIGRLNSQFMAGNRTIVFEDALLEVLHIGGGHQVHILATHNEITRYTPNFPVWEDLTEGQRRG
jgi:hypothetical protein